MKLRFLGANRQVTGSRYFLEAAGLRLMIDCGLFQERVFLSRNSQPPAVEPRSVQHLLLTHAHLDHCGLVPRLVAQGFAGTIHATAATIDLAQLVMSDSARIQEEDAAFERRHNLAHAVPPLYTQADADEAMKLFRPVEYGKPFALSPNLSVTWHDAGHILGSAILEVRVDEGRGERRIVFSGDLGMWNQPIIRDPTLIEKADYVVMESTYGDRDHSKESLEDQIASAVNDTVKRGGNVVVPTFAIERAQELTFYLSTLARGERIEQLMAFLDSPMAVDASVVFERHPECFDTGTIQMIRDNQSPFHFQGLVCCRTVQQSQAINQVRGSCVIMAASGMCTGGRIRHHLVHQLPRPESTVLFVGYQANETLGREILDGARVVSIFGQNIPVRASVREVHGMSAHADRSALLRWLGGFRPVPKRLFLTHGEESVSLALAQAIRQRRGADVVDVPQYGQEMELD